MREIRMIKTCLRLILGIKESAAADDCSEKNVICHHVHKSICVDFFYIVFN